MNPAIAAPYWGTRSRADPGHDVAARATIFATRMPHRAFYFGRTAAALHRLPLPIRFAEETTLHVGVRTGSRRVDALQVAPHHVRLDDSDLDRWGRTRVTSPSRTWCDLAASLSLPELVAVGDRLLWRRRPVTTARALAAQVDRFESRRGIRLLRSALGLLSDSADSAPESELRVAILQAGFLPPRVNGAVRLPRGSVFHPDLSWPDQRVAIEYEGTITARIAINGDMTSADPATCTMTAGCSIARPARTTGLPRGCSCGSHATFRLRATESTR